MGLNSGKMTLGKVSSGVAVAVFVAIGTSSTDLNFGSRLTAIASWQLRIGAAGCLAG